MLEPASEVITGATSSILLISKVTICCASALTPSEAITVKLYWLCVSKSGSVVRLTSPLEASIESALSLSADRLKVTPLLTSAESSAMAV